MKVFGAIMASILGLVVLIALAFAMELGGLKWKEFFAPKHADVERKVFKRTRSFNEAKVQELARYKRQYEQAEDAEAKGLIKATVNSTFADYDESLLPSGLKFWLTGIRGS